jgi:hypothetical protein
MVMARADGSMISVWWTRARQYTREWIVVKSRPGLVGRLPSLHVLLSRRISIQQRYGQLVDEEGCEHSGDPLVRRCSLSRR